MAKVFLLYPTLTPYCAIMSQFSAFPMDSGTQSQGVELRDFCSRDVNHFGEVTQVGVKGISQGVRDIQFVMQMEINKKCRKLRDTSIGN